MANRAPAQTEAWWYTPVEDEKAPSEEQSAFRFRPLTKAEQMEALDNTEVEVVAESGERHTRFRAFRHAYDIVLACLVDTRNFPAREHVAFPVGSSLQRRREYLELLPNRLIYELGNHVFDRSTLGESEKKSSTP